MQKMLQLKAVPRTGWRTGRNQERLGKTRDNSPLKISGQAFALATLALLAKAKGRANGEIEV